KRFATRFNDLLFKPVEFKWNALTSKIQINHCNNPFCKWFGMKQEKFLVKGKPSRYRLSGTGDSKKSNVIQILFILQEESHWIVIQELIPIGRLQKKFLD